MPRSTAVAVGSFARARSSAGAGVVLEQDPPHGGIGDGRVRREDPVELPVPLLVEREGEFGQRARERAVRAGVELAPEAAGVAVLRGVQRLAAQELAAEPEVIAVAPPRLVGQPLEHGGARPVGGEGRGGEQEAVEGGHAREGVALAGEVGPRTGLGPVPAHGLQVHHGEQQRGRASSPGVSFGSSLASISSTRDRSSTPRAAAGCAMRAA